MCCTDSEGNTSCDLFCQDSTPGVQCHSQEITTDNSDQCPDEHIQRTDERKYYELNNTNPDMCDFKNDVCDLTSNNNSNNSVSHSSYVFFYRRKPSSWLVAAKRSSLQ